jgi:hypothetical protein
MGAMVVLSSCGSSGAGKKQKGIVLQEGDRAEVTNANGFTTIQFPAELTGDDLALYDTDLLGYLLKSNAPISTNGNEYDTYRIYYYMHNSKEWLYQGMYENPYEITVSKVKSIKIANYRMRLREFNEQMPFLNNSKEKKSDSGYQNEIMFGENYYLFIDITLRD